MMHKRRPMLLAATSNNVNRQPAVFALGKQSTKTQELFGEGYTDQCSYAPDEHERDESPISVISHSATALSQPSSSCASMDHHLNHLLNQSNPVRAQERPNITNQSPFCHEQLPMSTCGSSTSVDDGSPYSLPAPFDEDPVVEEGYPLHGQKQQKLIQSRKVTSGSTYKAHYEDQISSTQETSTKSIKSNSSHSMKAATPSNINAIDDHIHHMDPRGRQEDVILLMENGLKSNGNNSKLGREEKYEPSKPSSKVECAEAEGLQMNRSKAIGRKEIASVSPTIDSAVENVLDAHTENNNKIAGVSLVKGTKTGMEASRWIEKASKAGNTTPSSAFKGQRNNDYSKFFTSSKWDDAGKWLCYDNQQISHPNRANISSASEQIVHSDSSTPSSRGLCVINKQFERTDGSSTASTTDHLNICNNAFKCRSDQILSSSREIRKACNAHDHGAESIQRDQQLLTTQSLSLNQLDVTEVVPECKENECHHATGNWMSARGFMSNVHLIKSSHHAVCHRVAPVSLSDDEVCQHFNHQSQSSLTSILPISTMSVNGRKDNRRAGYNRDLTGGVSDAWMWNDRFLSSDGEIMTKEDWKGVATGACMSDSELCHNYFSDQQFRSSIPGNNKKLRHHIIFQKLRSKYSRGVPDRDSQNEFMIQSPVHGRSASMKDACTEVSPSLSRRDMGTQMTPSAGSPIMSKCTSPARHNTPTCTSPTLDQNGSADVTTRHGDDRVESASAPCLSRCNMTSSGLENCDWTKLEVTGLPSAVTQASERNIDLGSVYYVCSPAKCRLKEEMVINDISEARSDVLITLKECDDLGPRASAWEQAEKAKYNAKYKRAEARIKAWEELQKAKVEGDMKRLEVKLEKLRSRATQKVLKRMETMERRAEAMRAAAATQHAEQMRRVRERACHLQRNAFCPGSFAHCFSRNHKP